MHLKQFNFELDFIWGNAMYNYVAILKAGKARGCIKRKGLFLGSHLKPLPMVKFKFK